MDKLFFDTWNSIIRTFVITIAAYAILIILLRLFGKRTLSRMNAFDFIVTVALGSTLATVLLTKDVALADGVLGFSLLIVLQFIISKLSLKSKWINQVVKAQPTLLFYHGKYIKKALKEERIAEEEILAKIRHHGIGSLKEVRAVVLEADGEMSVISNSGVQDTSTLSNVKYFNYESE